MRRAALVGAVVVAWVGVAPAHAEAATVEELRLDRAVPQEILRLSGFDDVTERFVEALGDVSSHAEAQRVVARHGERLWRRAVERAQGRGAADGLSREDDRPLYWARLGMTRELRQWQPSFALSDDKRTRLIERLERKSRGEDSIRFPKGVRKILVTGFDPFTLDRDIRISNPSGASALALDGTVIQTSKGPARIETAVFPVRWRDFTDGTVERTLRPHLKHVDMFTTVSQGRVGRFDVERYNGAWRGGSLDNENVSKLETIPAQGPQWTSTTLPYKAIVGAQTGRFPVYDNAQVTEIPAGGTEPVTRPDGPTEGSTARAGGGGNYLSNEIAYRATLLRDRLGLAIPGGHLHTPVLQFGQSEAITDPEFEKNRRDIIAQVRAVIRVAAHNRLPGGGQGS